LEILDRTKEEKISPKRRFSKKRFKEKLFYFQTKVIFFKKGFYEKKCLKAGLPDLFSKFSL